MRWGNYQPDLEFNLHSKTIFFLRFKRFHFMRQFFQEMSWTTNILYLKSSKYLECLEILLENSNDVIARKIANLVFFHNWKINSKRRTTVPLPKLSRTIRPLTHSILWNLTEKCRLKPTAPKTSLSLFVVV